MTPQEQAIATAAEALEQLLLEIARRDGEGNVLPNHLPAMRGARVALALCRAAETGLETPRACGPMASAGGAACPKLRAGGKCAIGRVPDSAVTCILEDRSTKSDG